MTLTSQAAPILQARALTKSFGKLEVLKEIDLELHRGEVLGLIGPSGSGKSTFIRCLNFMEVPTAGEIRFEGRPVRPAFRDKNEHIGIGTLRRHVGMVFQHFNLFPHKTVLQNVIEGPVTVCGKSKAEASEFAMEILAQVGMDHKAGEYPSRLSGGQKQRVAISRALAMDPQVLLLDEVTSALDPELVNEVLNVIRNLADKGMTMAIVTHEMGFAAEVSDRIFFLEGGRVAMSGTPDEVIHNPQNERLRGFLTRFHR